MKNKARDKRYQARRAKISKWMEDPEKFKEKVGNEITEDDIEIVHEIARESRLESLFEDLNIDKEKIKAVRKKVIKLSPKSSEYPLISMLYKNHNGKYKVEDLLYEYHDSILKEGIQIGISYGKKFIIEDIQNKRFTKEDFENMTEEEIFEYCDEVREEI